MVTDFQKYVEDFYLFRLMDAGNPESLKKVATEFKNEVFTNQEFQKFIDMRFARCNESFKGDVDAIKRAWSELKDFDYCYWRYLASLNTDTKEGFLCFHAYIMMLGTGAQKIPPTGILSQNKKAIDSDNELHFVLEHIDCIQITSELIKQLPDVSQKEKRKIMIKKLNTLFRYDKRPPCWIQGADEWPLRGGRPMVFREQKKTANGYLYYFYDNEGEKVVEQFY